MAGSTKAFLSLSSTAPFAFFRPEFSSLMISFCLAKVSCLLESVVLLIYVLERLHGNKKFGPRSRVNRIQTTSRALRGPWRFSQDHSQSALFSTREISSIVKLDMGGKLTRNILDGEF